MRCLFIINPSSGTKTVQKKLDKMIGQLILNSIVNHCDVFYTAKKDDAYNRCKILKENEYNFIVSVGGDGTVNEIISGLIESHSSIPLALLPAGTVNDFANHLNLPTTTKSFVKMIKDMNIESVDIGKVNNHHFANVIACGMFSDISFQVSKEEKEKFGPFAYYATGLRQLPQQLSTNMHLHITADDQVFDEDASLFMITNTSQVGGFKGITPHASIQDGLLDLLIIRKCSPADMLAVIYDYALNKHLSSPFVKYVQASHIKIESDTDLIYDVDGEEGTVLPIDITVERQKLNIIIPKE
jgi:diacylglycerol kinase (ATP)